MKILVTGSAGFIGSALSKYLLDRGDEVIGIDNHNDYYEKSLKESRLKRISGYDNYTHIRLNIVDREEISGVFQKHKPSKVVNLAAQAGVRYSITNPMAYIDSNLVGFGNILENCRKNKIEHLVYASSSSVYGATSLVPFSVKQNVDHPISFYAATKKANELMAHSYSHLYNLPTTGLRLFTVYGPWDRPDMALQKFAKAILNNETIKIFNRGNHERDFTYIDDIVEGIARVIDRPPFSDMDNSSQISNLNQINPPWKIYNIGNNQPVKLMDFINILEKNLGKIAKKEFLPMQPGDVHKTWANIDELEMEFNYKPNTSLESGISKFCKWFLDYYKN